ncbi:hypothetical protein bpr_II158 (plasmid) [Butyrivibrio proteoclasticus B316]|uniref:Uncharacterized protein n=1 Tax=Butyrivibrio proteoclasticus (strain ATCC 51982 / DSM 14932 / B316) TaxID=515622 RepID=E0S3W4_BUTPB|nr:hypothetical protein [Butyrivibrio proteoclasticus]ADL36096.1 hypothetical protein bpr_II158 [Butyrivibrio proteoclasticus B316]
MAKRVKTKRFFIETMLADSFTSKIEVSEKTYKSALKDAIENHGKQAGSKEDDFYVDMKVLERSLHKTTEKRTIFSWSICDMTFSEIRCKEGYNFITK